MHRPNLLLGVMIVHNAKVAAAAAKQNANAISGGVATGVAKNDPPSLVATAPNPDAVVANVDVTKPPPPARKVLLPTPTTGKLVVPQVPPVGVQPPVVKSDKKETSGKLAFVFKRGGGMFRGRKQ